MSAAMNFVSLHPAGPYPKFVQTRSAFLPPFLPSFPSLNLQGRRKKQEGLAESPHDITSAPRAAKRSWRVAVVVEAAAAATCCRNRNRVSLGKLHLFVKCFVNKRFHALPKVQRDRRKQNSFSREEATPKFLHPKPNPAAAEATPNNAVAVVVVVDSPAGRSARSTPPH